MSRYSLKAPGSARWPNLLAPGMGLGSPLANESADFGGDQHLFEISHITCCVLKPYNWHRELWPILLTILYTMIFY
jgi:hypothetical protein